ncbi:hypothetical protein [Lentzea nigeriaca]|uniref:hypothetical protein n=1 Tax=Lentzea nigeriaca TaxID=1128665 RepID=UPI00195E54ED|nr:hypothetical protein [Lentzea nigeriaca]MBM7863717.1 hypothetical protein [Lentzea nigeriaca]
MTGGSAATRPCRQGRRDRRRRLRSSPEQDLQPGSARLRPAVVVRVVAGAGAVVGVAVLVVAVGPVLVPVAV